MFTTIIKDSHYSVERLHYSVHGRNSAISVGIEAHEALQDTPSDEWLEEMKALQAIHESNFQQKGLGRVHLIIDDGRATLDLRIPQDYPAKSPLISIRYASEMQDDSL